MGLEKLNPFRTTYHGGAAAEYAKKGSKDAKKVEFARKNAGKVAAAKAAVRKCAAKAKPGKVQLKAHCGKLGTGVYCHKHSAQGRTITMAGE